MTASDGARVLSGTETTETTEATKGTEEEEGNFWEGDFVGEYLDDEMEPDPELNRISNLIIGAAIEVHRTLGPGHRESVYEEALAIEMRLRQIPFSRQHAFQIVYKGSVVGSGSLDFLVSERMIVDLKTIDEFTSARPHRWFPTSRQTTNDWRFS